MTSKTPLYWSYGKSKLPTNFYHHFEFRKSQDLISDVENPCTRISIKINLFSEFLTAILYTSFTIWNVWLLHRDQKLQKTPYTNFEHILTFCLTLNCHDVLAKFQFSKSNNNILIFEFKNNFVLFLRKIRAFL